METEYTKGKQFVIFRLENQFYGIDIQSVQIIERMKNIMRVPKTPECIQGVMNLRGEIIPVINLRCKFGMDDIEFGEDTRIIIVKMDESMVGIIVDQVKEVIELEGDQIENVPQMHEKNNLNYIQGVGKMKHEDLIVTLLNLKHIVEEAFEI